MALEKEWEIYQRELPNLLANEGKFVLIYGEKVIGFFDTYADAIQAGYDKFQFDPFFVKQVSALEDVAIITRDAQCPI